MRYAITGAGGLVGSHLTDLFSKWGIECVALNRNGNHAEWTEILEKSDVVINLAGYPILNRWTSDNRKQILESRVLTTRKLADCMLNLSEKSSLKIFISASATGIYPNNANRLYDEYSSETGTGFLSEVVTQWEKEALRIENSSVRVVIARFGVVLANNGGVMKIMTRIFRMGLGGRLGSGKQVISHIHIDDLVRAIQFLITKEEEDGVFNFVMPNPVSNRESTKILATTLRVQAPWIVPRFALNLLFGQASSVLLNSSCSTPKRLQELGFRFNYPTYESAVKAIIRE